MNKINLLTDSPIGEGHGRRRDGLGFETYARVLANAADGTEGPFTIGVFGEWGTGKTSLMKMIQRQLSMRGDILTVWFNAWRYEQEDHLIVPLVATIIREIERKENERFIGRLGDKAKNFLRALRAVAYGFSIKSKVKVPGLAEVEASFIAKDMIERESGLNKDPLLDKSLYYEAFERLSSIKISGELKIVVLIDDLDRCFPDKAVKLLESIKLVLCQTGFVFILGVARCVLQGYLQHIFEKEYGVASEGNEYLDKLVQLPFHIPPHWGRMGDFLDCALEEIGKGDREEIQQVVPIISAVCASNPRATIRFVNNLLIDRGINLVLAEQKYMEEIPIGYFAITRGLQEKWSEIFKILEESDGLCEKVYKWVNTKGYSPYDVRGEEEKKIAELLDGDKAFHALLDSPQGKDWLKESSYRWKATQFLEEQRSNEKGGSVEERKTVSQISKDIGRPLSDYLKRLDNLKKAIEGDSKED